MDLERVLEHPPSVLDQPERRDQGGTEQAVEEEVFLPCGSRRRSEKVAGMGGEEGNVPARIGTAL